VGSLVVCLVAHDYLGIEAVVWGQFLGYLGMVGGLRMVYGGSGFSCDWAGLRDVGLAFPRALFSVVIFIIFPFSDAFWGSRIGPSSVSYLGYAQRLLVGFSGLAVVGLTTVVFPRLARHAAEGKGASLREDLGLSIRIMLSWIVPSATLFSLLGTASIQILFQRGSFSLVDARALGALMPVMLCGMVAMSCCGLVFKGLFASGQVGFASLLSVIGSVVYFGLSGIFGLSHGIIGIGSAYAVSWWLVFGLGMRYLWREVPWKMIVLVRWRFVVQLAFATILLVLFGWLGTFGLPSENTSNGLGRLSIIVGTWFGGVLVYLVIGNRLPALLEVQWIIAKAVSLASRQTESLMSKDRLAKHQRNET
jgi:putative peptidoglycan lipid II flippase